jgi:hypothetical protein
MATILKKITITAQGSTSGPLYDIYYSVDGVTYTLCPDGNNVSLPTVGSSVIVSVDSTANFIKAVNLHPGCAGNDVIINFGGLTTTTTTSGPTTTTTQAPTTTTTIAPTTTTTTLGVNCYIYSWACDNEYGVPCSLSWTNCDGTPGSDFVSNGSAGNQCARQGTFSISNASFPTEGATCNPTTTTTTAAPTTTSTTTVAPTTTTTTTAGPTLVSGYKVYFDFGNSSSYPGSGTTVTNLGSGGSAMNGTLVNGPTYSSANGGIMSFLRSSSQYLQFDTALSASFTTMAIVKHNGSSTSWGTSSNNYSGWPNIRGNDGFILTNAVDGNTNVLAIIWAGAGANVPAGNIISPSDIAVFNSYAYTSNGSNEHKMYLNNGSAATSTNTYTRSNSGTITSYIGYDQPNNGYLNGYVMAYLQYDRVLSAAEISQNYSVFSSRF